MRLIEERDRSLVIGLLAGTVIMFGQPLRFLLTVAEDVSRTYRVDLVPGLFIFVLVSAIHSWQKHRDAVMAFQLNARDVQLAQETTAALQQLVEASHAIADAIDIHALRLAIWRHLPSLLKSRPCCLALTTADGWQWLIDPPAESTDLVDKIPLFLDRPQREEKEARRDHWLIFRLQSVDRVLGALVVDETTPLTPTEAAHLRTMVTVLSVAMKNVQLFADLQESNTGDSLTKCFNRAYAFEALGNELRRSTRTKAPVAVLMLDVDGFKAVNDDCGHLAGDYLLEGIGDVLRQTLRSSDVKCRYGGDEFLVVLPETSVDAALQVASNVRRAIGQLEIIGSQGRKNCEVSIGVAGAVAGELDPKTIVERADVALYEDKQRASKYPPGQQTRSVRHQPGMTSVA